MMLLKIRKLPSPPFFFFSSPLLLLPPAATSAPPFFFSVLNKYLDCIDQEKNMSSIFASSKFIDKARTNDFASSIVSKFPTALCPLLSTEYRPGPLHLASSSSRVNIIVRSKSSAEENGGEEEEEVDDGGGAQGSDEWLQRLPDKKKPLYSHSLPCIEAWLRKLGFYQSREDRALWYVENPGWHAHLNLDITDLYIRYLKTGPGNLEKDVERRFSYALSREDIENAILGGP